MGASGKLRRIFLDLNMVGLTGLLFPLASSLQVAEGQRQANPAAWREAISGSFGIFNLKTLGYLWASQGEPFALSSEQRLALKKLSGLDAAANLEFGTLSETDQGGAVSRFLTGRLAKYQDEGKETPRVYLADGLVRILFELGAKTQMTPWELIKFGSARAMVQAAVNRALSEWSLPQAETEVSLLTQLQNILTRQLAVQVLEKGPGLFTGLAATGGALLGGLLAVMAGAPVLLIAAALGAFTGLAGWLYALTVDRHYNNLEDGAREFADLSAKALAGDRLNGGKYDAQSAVNMAVDISDLFGAVQNIIREFNPAHQVPDAADLMSGQTKTGFGKDLTTLVEYLKNNTFAADSALAPLRQAVLAAEGLSGEAAAAVMLENAALATVLSASVEIDVKRADVSSLAEKRIFIQNAPEAFAVLTQQVETALQAASQTGLGDLEDLRDVAAGLRALSKAAAGENKGELMFLDTAAAAKLMPFIVDYDRKNTRQRFADFGEDFYQKSAVVTAGYTLENLTTADGAVVQVPVARVLGLTSRKPMGATDWLEKVTTREVIAAGYYQNQLAALQNVRQSDVLSGMLSRSLAAGATIFGRTFLARALNTLALDLNHQTYMSAQVGPYQSSIMREIMKNRGSGLQRVIQRRDLSRAGFQKEALTALVRILEAHDQDLALLQDVMEMMNRIAPSSGVYAGKILEQDFMLPNILEGRGMHGRLGKLLGILRSYPKGPQGVNLNDNVENLIKRQVMRSAAQAA
ncbi:MAG: hypothetical protein HGA76_11395 [Candidatus Firestonebacteria bacterium]|nr:hypothetical protein [Candidatus Firestonebacteria bacterium]